MKRESSNRARAIYDQLMKIERPDDFSNNDWAKRANVNTSFFTNLRNGSEPSVGNLRSVLEAVGISLPEFFVHEAHGRLGFLPTPQALAEAILHALPGLPKRADKRSEYLAEVVLGVLGLPSNLPSSSSIEALSSGADGVRELKHTLAATNRVALRR